MRICIFNNNSPQINWITNAYMQTARNKMNRFFTLHNPHFGILTSDFFLHELDLINITNWHTVTASTYQETSYSVIIHPAQNKRYNVSILSRCNHQIQREHYNPLVNLLTNEARNIPVSIGTWQFIPFG